MALVLKDRVKETANSPGTGTVTLLGASTGYQAFSVVGNGNTCYYCIADSSGANWEVGVGTYTLAGTTLARTTVLSSSNSGSLTNFSSGVQDVFVTYPAEQGVWLDASGNVINLGAITGTSLVTSGTVTGTAVLASNGLIVNNMTVSANYSIPSGYSASSVGPVTVNGGVAVTVPSGSRWLIL